MKREFRESQYKLWLGLVDWKRFVRKTLGYERYNRLMHGWIDGEIVCSAFTDSKMNLMKVLAIEHTTVPAVKYRLCACFKLKKKTQDRVG